MQRFNPNQTTRKMYRPAGWVHALLTLLVVLTMPLAAALAANPVQAQTPPATLVDVAGGAYEQVEVVLQADQAPVPGGVATFTFTAKPLRNAPDLTIIWDLPDGAILLGGAASENLGAVAAGQTVQQTRQVQFPQAGIYTVSAKAVYHPDAATSLTGMGILFFTINATNSTASDLDPRTPRYTPPVHKPTIDKSNKAVAAGALGPNAPQGCFNVQGFLTRGDRQPTPSGYVDVGGSAVPLHNILVEMREEDTISDDSDGHTVTDANGHFEFHFCDDDGFLNDELELYFRVCAEVWDGPNKIARIDDYDDDELYCFDSGIKDSEGGTVDFDVTAYSINSTEAQVFNIADSIYWAWKYWNNNGGPAITNTILVYWSGGKNQKGSFYSDTRTTMVVGDDPADLSPRRSFAQWHQLVEGTSEPWRSSDFTVARLVGDVLADVVLQFRSVRTLIVQDQLAQVSQQVRQSDQPVIVADAGGRILVANEAFDRLLQSAHPHFESIEDLAPYFTEPSKVRQGLRELISQRRSWRGELSLNPRSGQPKALIARADPVFAAADRVLGFVLLFTDLTERKAADAARRRFQQETIERHRSMSQPLDTNTDLMYRNLMSSLVGNAQLAALEITEGLNLDRVPDMLDSVQSSVSRSAEMLEHLLWHTSRQTREK